MPLSGARTPFARSTAGQRGAAKSMPGSRTSRQAHRPVRFRRQSRTRNGGQQAPASPAAAPIARAQGRQPRRRARRAQLLAIMTDEHGAAGQSADSTCIVWQPVRPQVARVALACEAAPRRPDDVALRLHALSSDWQDRRTARITRLSQPRRAVGEISPKPVRSPGRSHLRTATVPVLSPTSNNAEPFAFAGGEGAAEFSRPERKGDDQANAGAASDQQGAAVQRDQRACFAFSSTRSILPVPSRGSGSAEKIMRAGIL